MAVSYHQFASPRMTLAHEVSKFRRDSPADSRPQKKPTHLGSSIVEVCGLLGIGRPAGHEGGPLDGTCDEILDWSVPRALPRWWLGGRCHRVWFGSQAGRVEGTSGERGRGWRA